LRLDLRVGAGQVEVRRFEPGGVETILNATTSGAPAPITPPDPITPPTPTALPTPTSVRGNG
jgi:hypothetical protein